MKWRAQISTYKRNLCVLLCSILSVISSNAQTREKPTLKLPEPGLLQPGKDSSLFRLQIKDPQNIAIKGARVRLSFKEINPVVTRNYIIAAEISDQYGRVTFKIPNDMNIRSNMKFMVTYRYLESKEFALDSIPQNKITCQLPCRPIRCFSHNDLISITTYLPEYPILLRNPNYIPLPQILKNMGYY
jgi:hypothetical protein